MKLCVLGAGYTACHFVGLYRDRFTAVSATMRTAPDAGRVRALGMSPIALGEGAGDLRAAIETADCVLMSAAPDAGGDPFLPMLANGALAGKHLVYLSTIGVYGDHGGGWVDETTPPAPVSTRSIWRLAAERAWQDEADRSAARLDILRLAGIYGPGQNPLRTLLDGRARRIVKPGQVFNRIHVTDIAGALAAMIGRSPGGVWNVADDEPAPPQDVIAFAAELAGVPVPDAIPYASAELSPMAASFYGENKRASNARLRQRLGFTLAYPTYREGLRALLAVETG